jgi:hypothetical protein
MLKQFAPSAVIPPSPNIIACTIRLTDTAITAVHGPRRIAIIPAPTAWPVVPPGIGTLNIMIRKENAAAIAKKGICFVDSSFFSFLRAIPQNTKDAPYKGTYV